MNKRIVIVPDGLQLVASLIVTNEQGEDIIVAQDNGPWDQIKYTMSEMVLALRS